MYLNYADQCDWVHPMHHHSGYGINWAVCIMYVLWYVPWWCVSEFRKRNPAFKKWSLFIYDHGVGVCSWFWNVSVKWQRICWNISGSDAHFVNGNRCIVIYHITNLNHYFRDKKQKLLFLWGICRNSTWNDDGWCIRYPQYDVDCFEIEEFVLK